MAWRAHPQLKNATSKYILHTLLANTRNHVQLDDETRTILEQALFQIQGIARNINQQTRKLNREDEQLSLTEQREMILAVREQVESLLNKATL